MFRQSPRNRYQRNNGMKMKHVLQMSLLLGISIWLFVQMQRPAHKKASFHDNLKISGKIQYDNNSIKFGRKDLKPKAQVYGEDEKPIEVRPLDRSHFDEETRLEDMEHFDEETRLEDKEQERENMVVIPHVESFVHTVKEAETEEGGIATEGHVGEHEIDEDVKIRNDPEDQANDSKVRATEEENREPDIRMFDGDWIGNEEATIEMKRKMEKYLDKMGIVGIDEEKSEEITQENDDNKNRSGEMSEENENKHGKSEGATGMKNVGENLLQKSMEGVQFAEKKVAQVRNGVESEEKEKASDDAWRNTTGGEGFMGNKVAQEGNVDENEGKRKGSEYSRQKSIEGDMIMEKKIPKERKDGKNEGMGKVSQDSRLKSSEDEGFVEKDVARENEISEDKDEKEDREESKEQTGSNKVEKIKDGVMEKLSLPSGSNKVEKIKDSLSLPEGTMGGVKDEFNNANEHKTRKGEMFSDGMNSKSLNATQKKKLIPRKTSSKKKKAAGKHSDRKKNPNKMNRNKMPLIGEHDSRQNLDTLHPEKTGGKKSKLDMMHGNSNHPDNVKSTVAKDQNIALNFSRVLADGNLNGLHGVEKASHDMENHSSINDVSTLDERHKSANDTKLDDKAPFDDSNGTDSGQSSMDHFANLTDSSNEENPGTNETLPQEEKDAWTDLDTLSELDMDTIQ